MTGLACFARGWLSTDNKGRNAQEVLKYQLKKLDFSLDLLKFLSATIDDQSIKN
jgi:hypothetical protein